MLLAFRQLAAVAPLVLLVACPSAPSNDDGGFDASAYIWPDDAGLDGGFPAVPSCTLPGSLVWNAGGGTTVVPGGPAAPDLRWLRLPPGFCAHYFGNVPNARQIRFAPGGELFVASPTRGTTGGGPGGKAAIMVLSDDDHDGYADAQQQTFLGALPNTQGLLFTDGFFYYQDDTRIRRLPYQVGQRTGTRVGDEVVNVTVYESPGHWPKTLDAADDGTIYVGNGGDQNETCDPSRPFHGGILKIDGSPGGTQVAKGLRNPIAVKCQRGHDNCFATELALDYSASTGGREKLIPIRAGDDWGYPCCATKDLPYSQVSPTPDCSRTVAESSSFIIGRTPFGFDFEPGFWPGLWRGRVYVALHGDNGSWTGARVVGIAINPSTGLPYPATELDGGSPATMTDFATGWDDGHFGHGRPADIAMSRDGRLFLANDTNGDIVWISPVE